jgi:hypothetical protein
MRRRKDQTTITKNPKRAHLLALGFLSCFSSFALAEIETVSVKYFGSVNLNSFDCSRTRSSFVNRICYDKKKSMAVVLLKNTYYGYCDIPSAIIVDWLNAPSKGRFYNSRIKGFYRC